MASSVLIGAVFASSVQAGTSHILLAQNQQAEEDARQERRERRREFQEQRREERSERRERGGEEHRRRTQQQRDEQPRGRQEWREQRREQAQEQQRARQQQVEERRRQQAEQRERRQQAQEDRERRQERAERRERRREAGKERRDRPDRARSERDEPREGRRAQQNEERGRRGNRDGDEDRASRRRAREDDGDRDGRRENVRERNRERLEELRARNQERREELRERNRERREERRKFTRERLKDITRKRQRREENGRVIIVEPNERRIIRDRGRVIIEHDETNRLRGASRDFRREDIGGGRVRKVITRPNGVKIITVEDRNGRLIRRVKEFPNGRRVVLINNEFERRGRRRHRDRDRDGFGFYIDLPDFRLTIPQEEYYVGTDDADEEEIEQVLTAPPVEEFEEDYTLDEIRYSDDIRKRFRRLNLNTINFAFGSWEVPEAEIDELAKVARVINRIVERNPDEVFLVAGHTDAVGSEEDNLSLSDRRAETVARILTDEFDVPPENLVTQGYGESDLLIDTEEAELRNRRVEFMRITPALAQAE